MIPLPVLLAKVNEDGETALDYLGQAMKGNKNMNTNLSPKFWIDYYDMFDFRSSAADDLEDPDPEDCEISEALVAAPKLAHKTLFR